MRDVFLGLLVFKSTDSDDNDAAVFVAATTQKPEALLQAEVSGCSEPTNQFEFMHTFISIFKKKRYGSKTTSLRTQVMSDLEPTMPAPVADTIDHSTNWLSSRLVC